MSGYVKTHIRVKEIVDAEVYEKNHKRREPYTWALELVSETELELPRLLLRTDESIKAYIGCIVDALQKRYRAIPRNATSPLTDAAEIVYVVGDTRTSVWRAPLDLSWLQTGLENKVTLTPGGAFDIMILPQKPG